MLMIMGDDRTYAVRTAYVYVTGPRAAVIITAAGGTYRALKKS